jgi:hypothetical protein
VAESAGSGDAGVSGFSIAGASLGLSSDGACDSEGLGEGVGSSAGLAAGTGVLSGAAGSAGLGKSKEQCDNPKTLFFMVASAFNRNSVSLGNAINSNSLTPTK